MALTFWRGDGRRGSAASSDPVSYGTLDGTQTAPRPGAPDEYVVVTDIDASRPPAAFQAVRLLQAVLVIVIALLSFAVFWMIAMLLGAL